MVEIVDHHEDYTSKYNHKIGKVDIRLIGSATTIVADYLRQFHLKENKFFWEKSIVHIIMGTILLDTFNFDPKL